MCNTTRSSRLILVAGLLASAFIFAAAQDYPGGAPSEAATGDSPTLSPYRVDTRLAWDRRALLIGVSLDLARAGLRLPEGRLEAERMIERDLPTLAKDAVLDLQVDSHRTVSDTVMDGSLDPDELIELAKDSKRLESSFTRDMKRLVVTYEFPLDAVGALYVRHNEPVPAPPALEWRPGRAHTGIVIVVQGKLPVHGESVEDSLQPCLFPRIFDSEMRLILDRGAVDPQTLRDRGEVGYATDRSGSGRVGDDPLYVMAVELFGSARTDVVISRDDALAILSLPANRELLREGRVTLVVNPAALIASAGTGK